MHLSGEPEPQLPLQVRREMCGALTLPRIQEPEGHAMTGAILRLGEERRRIAVRVDDHVAVIDSESPLGGVGAAKHLQTAADVLGHECLESDRVRVVSKLTSRRTGMQGNRADAA